MVSISFENHIRVIGLFAASGARREREKEMNSRRRADVPAATLEPVIITTTTTNRAIVALAVHNSIILLEYLQK